MLTVIGLTLKEGARSKEEGSGTNFGTFVLRNEL